MVDAERDGGGNRGVMPPCGGNVPVGAAQDDWGVFGEPLAPTVKQAIPLGVVFNVQEKWYTTKRGYYVMRWFDPDANNAQTGKPVRRTKHVKGSRIQGERPTGRRGGKRKTAAVGRPG